MVSKVDTVDAFKSSALQKSTKNILKSNEHAGKVIKYRPTVTFTTFL